FQRASDPWLSFGATGDLYHISLNVDVDETGGLTRNALLVNKSMDGGRSWGAPTTIVEDDGDMINDKETITADPHDPNLVYAVWDRASLNAEEEGGLTTGSRAPLESIENRVWRRLTPPAATDDNDFRSPVYFARSVNAGQSWEPARQIFDPGVRSDTLGNQIVVLTDGTLVDVFAEIRILPNGRGRGHLWTLRSRDHGLTW